MVLEEYDPELIYIKGPDNIVADALSRLDLIPEEEQATGELNLFHWLHLEQEELPEDAYPLRWSLIQREQEKDSRLQEAVSKYKGYHTKVILGGGKEFKIHHYKDKVIVPQSLRLRVVKWYHTQLMHPGMIRTEMTIRQHFTWPTLTEDVRKVWDNVPVVN